MEEQISVTSFIVGGEYFAFDTMKIEHILESVKPTPVPLAKDYILGVINNHGNMIPVVDFRKLIGLSAAEEELPEESIIIVSVDGTHDTLIGFRVDEVDHVFDVMPDEISKEVVLQVAHEVQKSLSSTIQHEGHFIYNIDLEEITNVIAQ